MSRQIDVNDPASWDEDDKTYLRERVDIVPAEHREHLRVPDPVPLAVQTGEAPEVTRLAMFIRENFPERAGENPVDVAIELITETFDVSEPEDEGDNYEQWTVAELSTEFVSRNLADPPTGNDAKKKAPWIDRLRADDATRA